MSDRLAEQARSARAAARVAQAEAAEQREELVDTADRAQAEFQAQAAVARQTAAYTEGSQTEAAQVERAALLEMEQAMTVLGEATESMGALGEAMRVQTEAHLRAEAAYGRARAARTELEEARTETEQLGAEAELNEAHTDIAEAIRAAHSADIALAAHHEEAVVRAITEAVARMEATEAHWEAVRAHSETALMELEAQLETARAELAAQTETAARARELALSARATISRIETREEIEARCRHCAPGDPEYACDDVIDLEPLRVPVYINETSKQCYNEDGVIRVIESSHPNPAPDPLTRDLWNVPNELSIRTNPPTPLV